MTKCVTMNRTTNRGEVDWRRRNERGDLGELEHNKLLGIRFVRDSRTLLHNCHEWSIISTSIVCAWKELQKSVKQTMLKSKKLTPDVDGVENALIPGGGTTRDSGQGHWLAQIVSKRHVVNFESLCTRKAVSKKRLKGEQSITQEKKRNQSKKRDEINVIMG